MIYQYYAENPSCAPTGTGEYRMSLSESVHSLSDTEHDDSDSEGDDNKHYKWEDEPTLLKRSMGLTSVLLSHWSTLLFFGKPKDLLFLTVGFSLIYGALLAFNACLSQYLWKVAGISGDFAAVTGITNILVGFVVSSVVGMITGTLPHAKNAIVKALAVASAAGAFALAFCPYGVNQAHVVGLVCLPFGFAYGLVPCALDLAVEYTYPLAEEISAGLLYSAGGHIAFVSSVLLTHLLAGQKALWQGRLHPGTIYLLVQLVLGAGFLTYANGRCRRSEAEQRRARRGASRSQVVARGRETDSDEYTRLLTADTTEGPKKERSITEEMEETRPMSLADSRTELYGPGLSSNNNEEGQESTL